MTEITPEALEALSQSLRQNVPWVHKEASYSIFQAIDCFDRLASRIRTDQLIPAPSVDDVALAICKADGDCPCEVSCHKPGDIFHTYATVAISAMQVKQ